MPSPLYLRGTKRNRPALLNPAWPRQPRQHGGQDPAARERAVLTGCQRTPTRVSRTPRPHPAGREAFSPRAGSRPSPPQPPTSVLRQPPDPACCGSPLDPPCCGSPASPRGPAGRAAASPPPPQHAPRSPWRAGGAAVAPLSAPAPHRPWADGSTAPHLRVTPARPGPARPRLTGQRTRGWGRAEPGQRGWHGRDVETRVGWEAERFFLRDGAAPRSSLL